MLTENNDYQKIIEQCFVYAKNAKNREIIWTAEGFSVGNGYASFSNLTVSVVKTTVEKLSRAGLIFEK